MSAVKDYLLSITVTALICSILQSVTGKNSCSGKVITFMSGLLMTVAVLQPVITFKIDSLPLYPSNLIEKAESVTMEGTVMAENAMDAIIISQSESYILDKAAAMGADLEVEVLLDEHVPKSVRLRGAISPGAKASLNAWIQENFSISPEDLQWN